MSDLQAQVLLIEQNDEDASTAMKAIRQGVPSGKAFRVKSCEEAMNLLYNDETPSDITLNLRLIIMNLSYSNSCVTMLKKIKNSNRLQHIHVISVINSPGCIDLFSEAIRAGSTLCMVKNGEFAENLKLELGFYWQLFE